MLDFTMLHIFFSRSLNELYADNLLRSTNVYQLRGIVQLGNLLQKSSDIKDTISATDVFHT